MRVRATTSCQRHPFDRRCVVRAPNRRVAPSRSSAAQLRWRKSVVVVVVVVIAVVVVYIGLCVLNMFDVLLLLLLFFIVSGAVSSTSIDQQVKRAENWFFCDIPLNTILSFQIV
jgi:hypothetical protein